MRRMSSSPAICQALLMASVLGASSLVQTVPANAEYNFKEARQIAVVQGYNSKFLRSITNEIKPDQARVTVKYLLNRVAESINRLSVMKAEVVAEDVAANGVRSGKVKQSDNEAEALVRYLTKNEFSSVLLAEVVDRQYNDIVVQLYHAEFSYPVTGESARNVDVHEFGSRIYLDVRARFDQMLDAAEKQVNAYLAKLPHLKKEGMRMYVTCIPVIGIRNVDTLAESQPWAAFVWKLDQRLTLDLHRVKTSLQQTRAYDVRGLWNVELEEKCFRSGKAFVPEDFDIWVSGQMVLVSRELPESDSFPVTLEIIVQTKDGGSYIPFQRMANKNQDYQDPMGKERFIQTYGDEFRKALCQAWEGKYGAPPNKLVCN